MAAGGGAFEQGLAHLRAAGVVEADEERVRHQGSQADTSSTSFANPAIDIGRIFSDTFAGIAPASVPAFIAAQLVGAALAFAVIRVLYPDLTPDEAAEVMLPHEERTAISGAGG